MSKAFIIFEDNNEGILEIKIDFNAEAPDKDSFAHVAAAKAYTDIAALLKEYEDEPSK